MLAIKLTIAANLLKIGSKKIRWGSQQSIGSSNHGEVFYGYSA